ncbi:ATP-binding cassette sub-family C member 4, partial [Caligus rogercresseyi]
SSIGHLVNLLSTDVYRFDLSVLLLHYIWAAPLQMFVVLLISVCVIGTSSLFGGCILIAVLPLQIWMSQQFFQLRIIVAQKTDRRVRIINEILEGIRVIKMYAWEYSFMDMVNKAR